MAAGRWPPSVSRRAVLALKGAAALVVALGSGGFMSSLHRAARAACSLSFSNHAALPALPSSAGILFTDLLGKGNWFEAGAQVRVSSGGGGPPS